MGEPYERPNIRKLSMHTDGLPPRFYQDFMQICPLQRLTLTNVSVGEGLKYLAPLGQNIFIEDLCITFNKLISVELDKAREKRFGKKT